MAFRTAQGLSSSCIAIVQAPPHHDQYDDQHPLARTPAQTTRAPRTGWAIRPLRAASSARRGFADYETQRPGLPREASLGGRLMVHLAALTIGLYRALLTRGNAEDEARSLTARVTARAYEKMSSIPTTLSRLGARSARDRVQRATGLFRRFPFSPPAYQMVDVESAADVVAFDVRRCPVAELFRARGLAELCLEAWCNLDFALAESWGARLERRTTLAEGATHCDFRWRVKRPPRRSA